jgi:DNA-binding MarR family transcriptional regulator
VVTNIRVANEAWEALFRAQRTVMRELSVGFGSFDEVQQSEYGVLYALSKAARGLRITDLGEDVLLTQAGISRLIARLESRGLVERWDDPGDGRACLIRLTPAGREAQRRAGAVHARHVAEIMSAALSAEQLAALRDLSSALLDSAQKQGATRANEQPSEPRRRVSAAPSRASDVDIEEIPS